MAKPQYSFLNLEIQNNQTLFEIGSYNSKEKMEKKDGIIINTGKWSQIECQKFIEALFLFGNKWKQIQKYIQTRSIVQSRSHFQKFLLRLKRKYIEMYGKNSFTQCSLTEQHKQLSNTLTTYFNCGFLIKFIENPCEQISSKKNVDIKKIVATKRVTFLNLLLRIFKANPQEISSIRGIQNPKEEQKSFISDISSCDSSQISRAKEKEKLKVEEGKKDIFQQEFLDLSPKHNILDIKYQELEFFDSDNQDSISLFENSL